MSWTEHEGHVIEAWRLESFLGMRGGAACFSAEDSQGRPALIQLVPAEDAGATGLRRSWALAENLKGEHLIRTYATGSIMMGETAVVYAAMDLPDDDVAELVSRRSLAPGEATAIIAAAARGLEYLHERGMRHGDVSRTNIMFVRDVPKLSMDSVGPTDNAGRDADLRELGNAIVEMMTGQSTIGAAEQLPSPLRELSFGCWSGSETGWTAARVARVAAGEESLPAPVVAAEPERWTPPAPPIRVRLRWPAVALAAVVVIGGVFYLRRDRPAAAPVVPAVQTAPAQAVPVPARPAPPERAEPVRGKDRANSWAVVAATYADFHAAEKRANTLRRRLRAQVYPQTGGGSRYYVVLGSGLTSNAARALRGRVIRMGAPRDTYVTILPAD